MFSITTMSVFLPILFIQETAGQLFKDIAYAIIAAVALSLFVSLTVIPTAAARSLTHDRSRKEPSRHWLGRVVARLQALVSGLPNQVAGLVSWINRTWTARIAVILVFTLGTLIGVKTMITPLDYLPKGNRNLIFGLMTPPPGYNIEQLNTLGQRIESVMRPAWEAAPDRFEAEAT